MIQKMRLITYDSFTSENQRDRNMLTNNVIVLMRYYFSKILFI